MSTNRSGKTSVADNRPHGDCFGSARVALWPGIQQEDIIPKRKGAVCNTLRPESPAGRGRMRETEKVEAWVVYEAVQGNDTGRKSVCRQSEWDAIDARHPGHNKLVQGGITNETEAE